jgi:hypothetical protein
MSYYLQQLFQILIDPEYTTITMYDSPKLGESFVVVSVYAFVTSLDSFLTGYLRTDTLSIGLVSFLVSGLTTYLLWVVLAMIFHSVADLIGGLGEFPNALGFVGLGTAPLIFTSFISLILNLVMVLFDPENRDPVFSMVTLILTLIGMAWGAPGVICYFGMKNAEKLHPIKAFLVTFILFVSLTLLVLVKSGIL